ncbi:MAG: Gluconate 2-dehydrogenase subunit 3 [Myxococcaceae bacterium]|nr:Gluconate 2-dehydrogenase subunit 3 [Myxococcaceae bacterium]
MYRRLMQVPPPAAPPPLLAQKPSRRTLLKAFGVGGLVLAGGAWVWRTSGLFGPPAPGRMVFDADEFRILEKVCEAIFPGKPDWPLSADEAQTPAFVDTYVGNLYDDHHLLFRTLIRTLNISTIVGYGRSFYWLGLEKRQEVLQQWRVSDLRVRRAGYQSLTFAIKLGYFEDDRVREAAGFTSGCHSLPQQDRPQGLGLIKGNG